MAANTAAVCKSKRGKRFDADKETICLYIARSKNANLVVYDIVGVTSPEHGGSKINPSDAVDAYWLDLEPSYRAKSRARGKNDDREELNFIDKWQAYGVKAKDISGNDCKLEFVALPTKHITLHREKDPESGEFVPICRTTVNGVENCVLEHIFVQSDESGWIPSCVHIDLFGFHPTTHEAVTERIKN